MKRNIIIAILLTTMMLLGAVFITGNSNAITPKTGDVSVNVYYQLDGVEVSLANSSSVLNVFNYQGTLIQTVNGPSNTLNLSYGNYSLTVEPLYGNVAGFGYVIANMTTYNLTVSSPSQSVGIKVPIQQTFNHKFNVTNIASGNVIVSLTDSEDFTYYTFSTNGSTTMVPFPNGLVTVEVYYDSATFVFDESVSGTSPISVSVKGTSQNHIFGTVTSSTGSKISSINLIVLNYVNKTYNVISFSSNSFALFDSSWNNQSVIVTSPGYAPYQISPVNVADNPYSITLTPATSSISTTFSLSSNPAFMNESISYNLTNSTPVPNLPNASVGSLYWQAILDHFTTSYLSSFLLSQFTNYTNGTILVGSNNYQLISVHLVGSIVMTSSTLKATVMGQFTNPSISKTLYKPPLTVKIYGRAATMEPGKLNYLYSFAYNNTTIGLASSSVSVTSYVSPINISPLSSNGFFTLTFNSLKLPTFIDSDIKLSWKNIVSSDYVLNSSLNNTVFVVPQNTSVALNVSNGFYNPVTGQSNYQQSNFTWKLNGNLVGYGYNVSLNFGDKMTNTVNITGISSSGEKNSTSFTVYAYNGTPTANYTISYNGKTQYNGSTDQSSVSAISISVPQLTTITLSAYNSTLKIPGTNYTEFLTYLWNFTQFTSSAPNATNQFKTPTLNGTTTPGNLTVTAVTGKYTEIMFNVTVTVTTPPSPAIGLYNMTGKSITNPVAGDTFILSANKTTDPYYSFTQLQFNWTFSYPNGTKIADNSSVLSYVTGGTGGFNSSWIAVKINTLNDVVVSLKVSHSNITGYLNKTLTLTVNTPRIVVSSIYVSGKLYDGSTSKIYVNVTNKGTVNASGFQISILINGATVQTNTYSNTPLNVSQTRNVSFTWKPNVKGTVTVQFESTNSSEPAFFSKLSSFTTSVSIAPPTYTTPLIIVGIIAVIVIIFIAYYRFSTRGSRVQKTEAKPRIQIPEQKKLEKKK